MVSTIKLIKVPPNGQISIGKGWAGKQIAVQEVNAHELRIIEGVFVESNMKPFFTQESVEQLREFESWAAAQPAKETDIKSMRARFVSSKKR